MGFVASAMEQRATMGPSIHPARLDDPRVIFGAGYADDATGLNLGEVDVLGWPAVMQALRIICWSIGMLPCHLYEKEGDGKKKLRQADEHPVHWLLHDEPHPDYTPFEFNAAMVFSALLRGNGYAQIVRGTKREPLKLFPLDASRMNVHRVNGTVGYVYHDGGQRVPFSSDEILHIKGFSDGGLIGFALNQISRTSLAKGVAMDRYGARVFKNGMASGSFTEMTDPAGKFKNEEERDRFYNKLQDRLSGQDNWHKVIGLPYGMTLKNLGISPKDAQLIEGLTFQVQDISRLTGVPPSLLMELSRATFSNVEQQLLQFVQLCLGPWIVNIEQRYKKSLLSVDERKRFVIKFLVDALLRTDLKTQNDALRVAVGQPWMSVNEARDLKELAPVMGGDEVAKPLNMGNPGGNPGQSLEPAGPADDGQAPPQDGNADTRKIRAVVPIAAYRNAGRSGYVSAENRASKMAAIQARVGLRDVFEPLLTDAAGRLMRAEIRELTKLVEKHLGTRDAASLGQALEKYYRNNPAYAAAIDKILGPVMRSYANAVSRAAASEIGQDPPNLGDFIDNYTKGFTARQADSHLGQLLQLAKESDDPYEAINQRLKEWGVGRSSGAGKTAAEKLGGREAIQFGDAVARESLRRMGVKELVWLANSSACPICEELDGSVVGIEEGFVEASGEVDPADDEVSALQVYSKVLHPPLHDGCACMLAAG